MDAKIGVITETWLADSEGLDEDIEHLVLGAGLRMIYRNRETNARGFAHGGVCIAFKNSECSLKEMKLHNPGKYEVVVVTGNIKGCRRKLAVIGCYLPPNYPVGRGKAGLDFLAGAVSEVKRRLDDPMVIVAGDFNQWDVARALKDFPDLREAPVGNTRGDRSIDRIFLNVGHDSAGTVPPLETDVDPETGNTRKSDHLIAHVTATVERVPKTEMLTYTYRYYNAESESLFREWLASMTWDELHREPTSNGKGGIYQREVTAAQNRFFPEITVKRKASEPPWFNWKIKKKMRQKKGIYKREGRSPKWRRVKKILEDLIDKRRQNYAGSQKDALMAQDGERNFFKNVRSYQSYEREKPFNVADLFPGKGDQEVAEILAEHFNAISREFQPLQASEIPVTKDRRLPTLLPYQVAGRIRAFRKPKSMVKGDIFPALFIKLPDLLAIPLCSIYTMPWGASISPN